MRNKISLSFIVAAISFAISACVPDGNHHAIDASAGGSVSIKGGISYDTVKPIFAGVCAKCHSSGRPPDWLDFATAQKNALNGKLGSRVVTAKDMPPPSDPAAAMVTQKDRDLIDAWIKAGAPEHPLAVAAATTEKGSTPSANGDVPPMFEGKFLNAFVQSCASCHGNADSKSNVPRLSGLSPEYILTQLKAFRSADRLDPSYVMNQKVTADGVTPEDLETAAAYYGTVGSPKETTIPATTASFEAGRKVAERSCVQCHANPGPNDVLVPLISGQSAFYIKNQLTHFASAKPAYRPRSIMATYAKLLSPEDIENVSVYFSQMPLPGTGR